MALQQKDLTRADELFKLNGAVLDQPLLNAILKSFTKKLGRTQEDADSALASKQETLDKLQTELE